MNTGLKAALTERGADIVRFVDISGLGVGYPHAVLIGMALSKGFVRAVYRKLPVEREEFLEKEQAVEAMADRLAEELRGKGCRARSQSEGSNAAGGFIERAYIDPALAQGISPLPQKTIARLAGLGFVGRNNLLVTEAYGCALALCSVLTDAPVAPEHAPTAAERCGGCEACVRACPAGAITGRRWTAEGGRAALVDVSRCCCALACMVHCPWTMRYAGISPAEVGDR